MSTPFNNVEPDTDRLQMDREIKAVDDQSKLLYYSGISMSKKIPWEECPANSFIDIGNGLIMNITINDLSQENAVYNGQRGLKIMLYSFFPRIMGQVIGVMPCSVFRAQTTSAVSTIPSSTQTSGYLLRTRLNMEVFERSSWGYSVELSNSNVIDIFLAGDANNTTSAYFGQFRVVVKGSAGEIYFTYVKAGTAGATLHPSISLGCGVAMPTLGVSTGAHYGGFYNWSTHGYMQCGGTTPTALSYGSVTAITPAQLPERLKLVYPDSWFV